MYCIVCGREEMPNLIIMGKNICESCENEIIKLNVEDNNYTEYIDAIKNIFSFESHI